MRRRVSAAGAWRIAAVLALAINGLVVGSIVLWPIEGGAQSDDAALKVYWQDRYRSLRQSKVRLEQTIEEATKEYAEANRRNYRRSGVRHGYRTQALEAKAELARVQTELDQIYDEARRESVPITWLYEVENEPVDPGRSRATDAGDERSRKAAEHQEGRNPLYHGDDDLDVDANDGVADEYDDN